MDILTRLFSKVKGEVQDTIMVDLKNIYVPDGYSIENVKLAVKRHYLKKWHVRLLEDMLRLTEQMDDQREQLQNAKSGMAQGMIRAEFVKLLECRNALSPLRDLFEGVVADNESADTTLSVIAYSLVAIQDANPEPYFDVSPYQKAWDDLSEVLELMDAES